MCNKCEVLRRTSLQMWKELHYGKEGLPGKPVPMMPVQEIGTQWKSLLLGRHELGMRATSKAPVTVRSAAPHFEQTR